MSELLPFVVVGLASGSIYGLAGAGLVMTYRTAGVFNFAHGAIAALGAFVFYDLHVTHSVAWPVALVITVAGVGLIGGLVVSWMARPLASARVEFSLVGTVGLLLLIQGYLIWKYGAETRLYPAFLPTRTVEIGGVAIQYQQIIIFVVGLVLVALLAAFLRMTTIGTMMRGVVDDASLVSLSGTPPKRVQGVSWIMGCAVAALSGVLIAPSLGLDASLLTLLVVQAFGAAAIGLFRSIPLTFAGGLVVGVGAALVTKYGTTRVLQGLSPTVPFLILFLALLVVPARKLIARQPTARFRPQLVLPRPVMRLVGSGGVVLLALIPWIAGIRLTSYNDALVLVPMFLSLGLLIYVAGSISLCHAAFAALGATTFAHLSDFGLPWGLALLGAGLAVIPLGLVVSIPAIRLRGIYLALATFGFGILLEKVAYPAGFMFGINIAARAAPRPKILGIDGSSERGFYLIALVVVLICVAIIVALLRNRIGRLLRAMGDSPIALSTLGLSVNVTRVLVFCLAAALAGISGALAASHSGRIGATGFTYFQSLLWLTILLVCGRRPLLSPFLAAAALVVVPAYAPNGFVNYQTMIFGAAAILTTILPELRLRRVHPTDRLERSPARERTREALTLPVATEQTVEMRPAGEAI